MYHAIEWQVGGLLRFWGGCTKMEPVLVLYARGAVNEVVACLCEVSKGMAFSLWSMKGNPCALTMSLPTIAKRICIIDAHEIVSDRVPEDHVIGTVHIVRTSHIPLECRISFHLESLSGKTLPTADKQSLQRFCAKAYMLLESRNLLIEEREPKLGTGPFQLSNSHVDTGPLRI
jgi:hypothetical protein